MARARDPFGEALDILRVHVRDGVRPPGAPLIVIDVARALRVSPTPVREALSHLSGEGLVEVQRGRGFHVRRLDAADLIDFYQLHGLYVSASLSAAVLALDGPVQTEWQAAWAPGHAPTDTPHGQRAAWETLFSSLIRAGGSRAIERAHDGVADQLAVARLVEGDVLSDIDPERRQLVSLMRDGDRLAFHAAAEAYHQRRVSAARQIASAIRDVFRQ